MDSAKEPSTVLSLCTGYAGLEVGLKRAIGPVNVLAHVEIESFQCANLVSKMESGLLDAAPIWTDLTTFPAEIFSGRIDYLIGGYPCQDFSQAGKREGFEGKRGKLWGAVLRTVRLVRPRFCIFENVEGHITLGLDTVLSDLAELGYRFKVGLFAASEAGAPHQRNRVFILAYCDDQGSQGSVGNGLAGTEGEPGRHSMQCCGERALADTGSGRGAENLFSGKLRTGVSEQPSSNRGEASTPERYEGWQGWPLGPGPDQHPWEPTRTIVGNPEHRGQHQRNPGIRPPEETEGCKHGEVINRPDQRATEPSLGGNADGSSPWMDLARLSGLSYSELEEIYEWMAKSDCRIDELRSCGNGVVPQQAEVAIRSLMKAAGLPLDA